MDKHLIHLQYFGVLNTIHVSHYYQTYKYSNQNNNFTNLFYAFFSAHPNHCRYDIRKQYIQGATYYNYFKMNFFVVISKKIPFRGLAKFPTKGTIIKKINVRIYLTKLSDFTTRYPLIRGMITYSFTWPISNLCQQAIRGSNEWDFAEALRFCLYGSCFVAPTLYGWLRLAANMWPQLNYRSAIAKASHIILWLCDFEEHIQISSLVK